MWSAVRKEVVTNAVTGGFLTIIASIVASYIRDERIRNIAILFWFIAIVLLFVGLPYLMRLARGYVSLHSDRSFRQRSHIQHDLMHQVRDACVKMLPYAPEYNPPSITEPKCIVSSHPILEKNKDLIVSLLERLVELFQPLVPPGTKVWASIRDRRADDCYHTFARAGLYNQSRKYTSIPLHKDSSRVILKLKDSVDWRGECVMVTGSTMGPEMWEGKKNDLYGEDKSVLLAAVLTRSWHSHTGQWTEPKLAWIIGISADRENIFSTLHVSLMKQCVDMFSLLANVMIRCDYHYVEPKN
jgi:hypothetical protein